MNGVSVVAVCCEFSADVLDTDMQNTNVHNSSLYQFIILNAIKTYGTSVINGRVQYLHGRKTLSADENDCADIFTFVIILCAYNWISLDEPTSVHTELYTKYYHRVKFHVSVTTCVYAIELCIIRTRVQSVRHEYFLLRKHQ